MGGTPEGSSVHFPLPHDIRRWTLSLTGSWHRTEEAVIYPFCSRPGGTGSLGAGTLLAVISQSYIQVTFKPIPHEGQLAPGSSQE